MFSASFGVQRPVLLNALSSARDSEEGAESWIHVRINIIMVCNWITELYSGTETTDAKYIQQLCAGFLTYIAEQANEQQLSQLSEHNTNLTAKDIKASFERIGEDVRNGIRNEGQQYEADVAIDANNRRRIEEFFNPLLGTLSRLPENSTALSTASADCPRFFSKSKFRYRSQPGVPAD